LVEWTTTERFCLRLPPMMGLRQVFRHAKGGEAMWLVGSVAKKDQTKGKGGKFWRSNLLI
jgi:hypothetical protein